MAPPTTSPMPARGRQTQEATNQHHFLVVGFLGQAEPITVRMDEQPFVGMLLETGPGWRGIAPGTSLRVTYIKTEPESEASLHTIPRSMLCVVAL
ncbi:MAG: hypothetical protein WB869_21765 [Candidatus Acidiferrales bacterium]|jgi:hypothetical protein